MSDTAIGKFIKQRRDELKLRQEDIAHRLGEYGYTYSVTTIGHWERGRADVPLGSSDSAVSFLTALAKSLEVPELRLLEVAGYLKSTDLKFDVEVYEFANLLNSATPAQRKIVKQLLEEMIAGQQQTHNNNSPVS